MLNNDKPIILAKAREDRQPKLSLLVRIFSVTGIPQEDSAATEIESFELEGNTDFLSKEFDKYISGKTLINLGIGCIDIYTHEDGISVVITGDDAALMTELYGKIKRRWL